MSKVRPLPPVVVQVILVAAGIAAILGGVYLLAGLAWALIVGGVLVAATGLLVDF